MQHAEAKKPTLQTVQAALAVRMLLLPTRVCLSSDWLKLGRRTSARKPGGLSLHYPNPKTIGIRLHQCDHCRHAYRWQFAL